MLVAVLHSLGGQGGSPISACPCLSEAFVRSNAWIRAIFVFCLFLPLVVFALLPVRGLWVLYSPLPITAPGARHKVIVHWYLDTKIY